MRAGILLLIGALFFSGCLEGKLTIAEANECLLSTRVEQSTIPACDSTISCETKLNDAQARKIFHYLPAGSNELLARKSISTAWKSLNAGNKALEKVHESCSTLKMESILSKAVVLASELQSALKGSEDAQKYTYRAIEVSIAEADALRLDEVKDTRAFQAYAELVQMYQEITTGNPVSSWGSTQAETNAYFEQISQVISSKSKNPYAIKWSTIYEAYKTGVLLHAGNNARGIIAVSPLWQGALSTVLGKKENNRMLEIVSRVKSNEVITHVERVVSPGNGLIIHTWKKIHELEDEIRGIHVDEKLQIEIIKGELIAAREKWNDAEKNAAVWNRVGEKIAAWQKTTKGKIVTIQKLNENDIQKIEDKYQEQIQSSAEKKRPIGTRLREWREMKREIEVINQKISWWEKQNDELLRVCQEIITARENTSTEAISPENCANTLDEWWSRQDAPNAEWDKAQTTLLSDCVARLNEWEWALGESKTSVDWFEYAEGKKSLSTCESAAMNAQKRYEESELVKEANEQSAQLKRIQKMFEYAEKELSEDGINIRVKIEKIKKILEQTKPLTREEWRIKISERTQVEQEMTSVMGELLQKIGNKITWKIIEPTSVKIGASTHAVLKGVIFSHAREKISAPFVMSITNPGLQTVSSSEGRAIVEGNWIILESEAIPEGGIILSGEGSVVGARVLSETITAEAIGTGAFIQKNITLETRFAPVQVEWNSSTEEKGSRLLYAHTSENNWIEIEGSRAVFSMENDKTHIEIGMEWPNAFVAETALTHEEIINEKIQKLYMVKAKNNTNQKMTGNIYTGIYGDPSAVEKIRATNENGVEVKQNVDAGGNSIIAEQLFYPKQERTYNIHVEIIGESENSGVVERLLAEARGLMETGSKQIQSDVEKTIMELLSLRGKKDSDDVSIKLMRIQNEISRLQLAKQTYEEEWIALTEEWEKAKIKNQNTVGSSEIIARGDNGIVEKNSKTVREAITALLKQTIPVPVENNFLNNDSTGKIEEGKKIIVEMQEKLREYEKSTSVGCGKLIQVNFVCPVAESTLTQYKKAVADFQKLINGMNTKNEKLSSEKMSEEWAIIQEEWNEKQKNVIESVSELDRGMRAMKNAAIERANALAVEANKQNNDEVKSALEKARAAIDNGEFGKSIYISQNVLAYLNSTKISGFSTFPSEGWPLLGIILLVGVWAGWKEWKKKKPLEVVWKTIPKNTKMNEKKSESGENAHPTTQGGHHPLNQEGVWTKNQGQRETFEMIEELIPHSEKKI